MKLENIFEDLDELEEPECMDRILIYLEEIKEEDDLFIELLLDKLHGEEITWLQPWYQQTNSVSRPLKETNEKSMERYKTDALCKAEHDQLVQNWKNFIQEYDVPDKLVCLARWRNKCKSRLPTTPEECARRFVLAYLARGLERTIFHVFRHIQTAFGGPVKGAYSPEEEKIMRVCFIHHPNHAVTLLSKVLGREPRGIYKRLQKMYNGKPDKKKIKWTIPLASKFLKLLMKYTGLPLEELQHKRFEKHVWLKLEEDFDHNYIYLQKFWYYKLHVQVLVKSDIKMRRLRKKIIKILREKPYQIWSDIRWKDVAEHFPDGYTHHFIYSIGYNHIAKNRAKYHKVHLQKLLDLAMVKLQHTRKRRMRMLAFNENGELEQVIYKKSKNEYSVI